MRHTEGPNVPIGNEPKGLTLEQTAAINLANTMVEKILDDHDLCTWIRNQFVHDRKTVAQIADEFIESDYTGGYELESRYPRVVGEAIRQMKYEVLTPKEIINLRWEFNSRNGRKGVEAMGRTAWHLSENQLILRDILHEEGATKKWRSWKKIAEQVKQMTGQTVSKGQCAMRLRNRRGKPSESTSVYAKYGTAGAKARGQLIWSDAMDEALMQAAEDPKHIRTTLNMKYILGRVAEEMGREFSHTSISQVIKRYNLLAESDIVELEEGEE